MQTNIQKGGSPKKTSMILNKVFLLYCTAISTFILLSGLLNTRSTLGLISVITFVPVSFYFFAKSFKVITKKDSALLFQPKIIHLFITFFVFVALIALGVVSINSSKEEGFINKVDTRSNSTPIIIGNKDSTDSAEIKQ